MSKKKSEFPRIAELKLTLHSQKGSFSYVFGSELNTLLRKQGGPKLVSEFSTLFGVQTCPVVDNRPALYAHDVEAVLERMSSGALTGSQKFWD